ncbi:MAG: AAA family ATPase [Candidatus Kapaibacteriota bacterium]
MRLRNITLENFKCFGKKQRLDLGRLTILTGANSSGKSSLMYSILGAIQSGEFPLQFSTNGKYVNMGDFQDIAFQRKRKNEITLAFTFENATTVAGNIEQLAIETVWIEDEKNNLPRLHEIVIQGDFFSISLRKAPQNYILNFSFEADSGYPDALDVSSTALRLVSRALTKFTNKIDEGSVSSLVGKFDNPGTEYDKAFNKVFTQPVKIDHLEVSNLDSIYSKGLASLEKEGVLLEGVLLEGFISSVLTSIDNFDATMNFISSFRLHPERTYLETTKSALKVERFGENYLDQIIAWETNESPKFGELMTTMEELGLLSGIKASRMHGGRFEITVQSKKDGVFTSLADVGFGISQFLPILVADLQLPGDSTLFVAQPEIHLHPDIQSRFGEFLIKQTARTKKNYIIETHSEYCLNRLRLGIVKGEIDAGDVAVYYLNASKDDPFDTDVHTITFTKSGQILGAPPDFFTTYQMDVMEIALHAE